MKKYFWILYALILFTGCSTDVGEIHLYVRDPASGTREAFEKTIQSENMSKYVMETSSNQDMLTKISQDIHGIGYVSYKKDFDQYKVKALAYNGIEANEDNILNESYPLSRPYAFITRASGDYDSLDKQEIINAFVDYMMNSIEGKLSIQASGGIVDVTKGIQWKYLANKYPILQEDNSDITIVTCGSTSVEQSLRTLLESFSPLAGNVSFVMNHSGSSDAYKRVLGTEKDGVNKADIGFVSRAFKIEEDIDQAMNTGTYCQDAIVLVVHSDNDMLDNLTQQQVVQLFDGTICTWKELYE